MGPNAPTMYERWCMAMTEGGIPLDRIVPPSQPGALGRFTALNEEEFRIAYRASALVGGRAAHMTFDEYCADFLRENPFHSLPFDLESVA